MHEKVHDEFAKKLTAKMAALKVGNGLDDGVAVGPLVNADAKKKVMELVDDAVGKGAKILTGGKSPSGPGHFYPPTVLDDVPDGASMLREEIFGPVAAIQTFKSEDEVIKRANDTEYGLVAYLYTNDLSRGMRVSEQLDFGMIGLNRGLVSDPAAPFGGMKQSGIGREGAHEGLMEVHGDAVHLGRRGERAHGRADAAARRDRCGRQDHAMVQVGRRLRSKPGDNCSRSRPTRYRWRCRRPRPGCSREIRVPAGAVRRSARSWR